jgi:peptidoglycan/LPS O-acetylase OafA/YrhL
LSAEAVLVGHVFFWLTPAKQLIVMASFGVVFFFILSGLLISYSVFSRMSRSRNYSFMEYFIDRFARIYSGLVPALFIILIIDAVHIYFFPGNYYSYNWFDNPFFSNFTVRNFFGSLFLVQNLPFNNLYIGHGFGSARSLWTLSVEWWLYLSFGWAVINFSRYSSYSKKTVYLFALGCLLVCPVKFLVSSPHGNVIFAWYFGVAITLLLSKKVFQMRWRFYYIVFSIVFLVFAFYRSIAFRGAFRVVSDFPAYELTTVVLLASSIFLVVAALRGSNATKEGRTRRGVKFMADYSYTLYLIHNPVIILAGALFDSLSVACLLSFVMSNLLAMAVAYHTEMRHRRLAAWIKGKILVS